MTHRLGLVSDTHGLVRPQLHVLLAGVEAILHAGDVGDPAVLHELALIAPVFAVRGNVDDPWDPNLPATLVHRIDGLAIRVTHGDEMGRPKPPALAARYPEDVIVYGHTHQALVARVAGRLVVNPGSAGPKRFRLLPSVARLTIEDGRAEVEMLTL